MRTSQEILTDICIAFESNIYIFNTRPKKSNEQMSLITQAFVFVMLSSSCKNATSIAKIIGRTPAIITLMRKNADLLLSSKHAFAEDFRNRIKNSCPEGEAALLRYKTK